MKKHVSYKINNKNGWDVYVRGVEVSATVVAAWIMHEPGMMYSVHDKGEKLVEYKDTGSIEDFLLGYLDQELRHGS